MKMVARLPNNVFTTCPDVSARREPVVSNTEYKIYGPTGSELMVVKNAITLENVKKAAKCAKLKHFSVRKVLSTVKLEMRDFPIKSNLVIMAYVELPSVVSKSKRKPYVFHVCEQTSVAPAPRKTPHKSAKKVVSKPITLTNKRLIRTAIEGMTAALNAMKKLEKTL
jgi:hypothetical protein